MKYTVHKTATSVDLTGLSIEQIRYLHMLVCNMSRGDDRRLGMEEEADALAQMLDQILEENKVEVWLARIDSINMAEDV